MQSCNARGNHQRDHVVRRSLLQATSFARGVKRLGKKAPEIVPVLAATLASLREDAFDPALKTHKLKGNLAGLWSCNLGYDLRIVFEFVKHGGDEAILLQSIGTHDQVY